MTSRNEDAQAARDRKTSIELLRKLTRSSERIEKSMRELIAVLKPAAELFEPLRLEFTLEDAARPGPTLQGMEGATIGGLAKFLDKLQEERRPETD